ncbi:MAG: immunity 53 family protein, partial [Bryobacteraceae bacterium]
VDWLQHWYKTHCDGEWEHDYGIHIETLDNPGWMVRIDLAGTALQDQHMDNVIKGEVNHSGLDGDSDWIDCRVDENRFVGAGGPNSLPAICDVFRSWSERLESSA